MMRCGTAWHDAELGCPTGSWASHPARRVPDLLVPPQPWPAVTGARGGATSTPTNRSVLSQGVLPAACASLPELARPKPLHPPWLPSQQPAQDGLRWPAAAGFSHLLLAEQLAQTHVGGPHHATATAPDDRAGSSSCWCRAQAACGVCPAAHPRHTSFWGGSLQGKRGLQARPICEGLCLAEQPLGCPSPGPAPVQP